MSKTSAMGTLFSQNQNPRKQIVGSKVDLKLEKLSESGSTLQYEDCEMSIQ